MSEYQYIGFRAIDGPVSEKNLKYMRQQSTRAEITPWAFDNEYDFGDFHGDEAEMLRRGYDFHFHYANFGIRKVMIRLPNGLPDAQAARPYFDEESVYFLEDQKPPGGILCVEPYFEPGDLEELWDLDDLLNRLLPVRAEIMEGDLRPLYLAHLAVAGDNNHDPEKEKDAPVPAGLGKLTDAQHALAELYGLNEALIAAAAENGPSLPERNHSDKQYTAWLQHQPEATKTAWLAQLMADPRSAVRREILAKFQKSLNTPSWPTNRSDRTIAELKAAAEEVQQEMNRKSAEKAARQRAKKLSSLATDPMPTLRKTEQLVKQRSTEGYHQIAELLADLREALSGTDRAGLPDQQARKLRDENPTLKRLTSALRSQGF